MERWSTINEVSDRKKKAWEEMCWEVAALRESFCG